MTEPVLSKHMENQNPNALRWIETKRDDAEGVYEYIVNQMPGMNFYFKQNNFYSNTVKKEHIFSYAFAPGGGLSLHRGVGGISRKKVEVYSNGKMISPKDPVIDDLISHKETILGIDGLDYYEHKELEDILDIAEERYCARYQSFSTLEEVMDYFNMQSSEKKQLRKDGFITMPSFDKEQLDEFRDPRIITPHGDPTGVYELFNIRYGHDYNAVFAVLPDDESNANKDVILTLSSNLTRYILDANLGVEAYKRNCILEASVPFMTEYTKKVNEKRARNTAKDFLHKLPSDLDIFDSETKIEAEIRELNGYNVTHLNVRRSKPRMNRYFLKIEKKGENKETHKDIFRKKKVSLKQFFRK